MNVMFILLWKGSSQQLDLPSSLESGCKLNIFMVKNLKKKFSMYAYACIITNFINHMAGKAGSLIL